MNSKNNIKMMSGNEAIARGAYEGGVKVATAYPGTPSTEILEFISKYDEIYSEWSVNEKVALEVALGASIGGARAIVCMKHVGLNVAADPLFSAGYTGVNGGLVIVTADDPSMHSSQNEQDNRYYARSAGIPLIEPSDSHECKELIIRSLEISEAFDTPVLFRTTTRVSHSYSLVEIGERREVEVKGYDKNFKKYNLLPVNATKRRILVKERLQKLREFANTFSYNRIELGANGSGRKKIGIITSGITYQYVKEVFPDAYVLKLTMSYPLPIDLIRQFISQVDEVYVIEELEPFIENEIKSFKIVDIKGKEIVPDYYELSCERLREAFKIQVAKPKISLVKDDLPARPPALCPGCSHTALFYVVNKLKLNVTGDIGCYTLGALPPLNAMDTCICMGASITGALGLEKALGKEFAKKLVAIIGDSTFIHSGITGLIDVVYNKGITTVIILDNDVTAMTGHQPHPATGFTIKGEKTNKLRLEEICRACGVNRVRVVDAFNIDEIYKTLKEELEVEEPSVIVVRGLCVFHKERKLKPPLRVDLEKCRACGICLRLGCPALNLVEDKKVQIDPALCVGCTNCQQLCKFSAIG